MLNHHDAISIIFLLKSEVFIFSSNTYSKIFYRYCTNFEKSKLPDYVKNFRIRFVLALSVIINVFQNRCKGLEGNVTGFKEGKCTSLVEKIESHEKEKKREKDEMREEYLNRTNQTNQNTTENGDEDYILKAADAADSGGETVPSYFTTIPCIFVFIFIQSFVCFSYCETVSCIFIFSFIQAFLCLSAVL